MKNHITLILILLFSSLSLAQTKGYVTYEAFSGVSIVANPPHENGYNYEYEIEKGTLYFQGDKSIYQQIQNKTKTIYRIDNNGPSKTVVNRDNRDETGWVYFKDIKNKRLLSRESYWNKASFVSVKENFPKIQWKITSEKKKIGGYSCIKAEADFLGRKWEAWFTYEIPVQLGPWKLGGLPGLILEAQDKKLDFVYKLKEIKLPADFSSSKISESYFGTTFISREDFLKKDKKKKDKYVSYLESVALENDGSVNIKFDPTLEVRSN
ncbi:GLPGLI family protein [Flavobacteriaceae bacterium R38]|nr:GLPGLI family protein [Flavobacteriaceae bacterium R38]